MPTYYAPGAYIEETSGPRPIEGVSTAVAAFIGFAPAGPTNQPTLVTSWQQYLDAFGKPEHDGRMSPHMPGAYLSHAVSGYFANGGSRCYIVRVLPPGAPASSAAPRAMIASSSKKPLLLVAPREAIGADIRVTVSAVTPPSAGQYVPGRYTLKVTPVDEQGNRAGQPVEVRNFTAPESLKLINEKNPLISVQPAAGAEKLAAEAREPRVAEWQIPAGGQQRQVEVFNSAKSERVFVISARDPAGPTLQVKISQEAPPQASAPSEGQFTLEVVQADTVETFRDVSFGRRRNVLEAVNRVSRLVTLEAAPQAPLNEAPRADAVVLYAPKIADLAVQAGHLTGAEDNRSGLAGLKLAEDVTMVCCPDLMSAYQAELIDEDGVKAVQLAMIAHCEGKHQRDRIAILDPLPGLSPQQVQAWRSEIAQYDSAFAALYYPWVEVLGPGDKKIAVPPCGHVAGVYARNDSERGVHKAPANEVLREVLAPATPISLEEQELLNPEGINCLRAFSGRGVRVWGARTLSSDPQWRYISTRRLFNYVEKSIWRTMQWVVFEPNNHDLWARVQRDIRAFLTSLWRQGMLFGPNPDDSFFVICDAGNNPEEERDQGRLYVDIGLAAI
ncbi:phage tail sheath subtilisin-like domain-containing protein, partial [Oscillochloris sp. ZM17-4]|uniref:phage tail sheath subtilisin-like domain-containing protein n=1 Tax=Oscillochloris sp. ZM17-4 TaxID=2866714 RepID=UPI001C73A53C